jgi:hypothetical protein
MQYFRNKLEQVERLPAVAYYGAALSLAHVVTAYHWSSVDVSNYFSADYRFPICWPFFQSCTDYRFLSESDARLLLKVYGALGVVNAILFGSRRVPRVAYLGLVALFGTKLALYLQDFSAMGNYHYMSLVADFVYLFLPAGPRMLPLQIVAFYYSAGLIKFNTEWISGASVPSDWIAGLRIYRMIYWTPAYAVPFSIYGAFIEVVIVFGLLARNRWVFWLAFLHVVGFHAFSWGIVGYLYPCIMFCLITAFPLARLFPAAGEESIFEQVAPLWRSPRAHVPELAFLSLFAFLQVYHRLLPGDSAVTGQGRLYGLNMLDATTDCVSASYVKLGKELVSVSYEKKGSNFEVRAWCEPYAYFFRAKSFCREYGHRPDFGGVSLHLLSKRRTDPSYYPVIAEDDICGLEYSSFFPNAWIRTR